MHLNHRIQCLDITERKMVCLLLTLQLALLSYSSTRHSPTDLEPAFLASGISHWRLGTFQAYRVNPPLVRMVAAIPVIAAGYKMDWPAITDAPGSRIEYGMGQAFLMANEAASLQLVCYARWACIPFNLIGSYFAYRWAKDLYGAQAGLIALALYVFEPNLLAHGELITPDGAATAFGLTASYAFWRWLKQPSWKQTFLAGATLGIAELTKMTWIVLFGLWPLLWGIWHSLGFADKFAIEVKRGDLAPSLGVIDNISIGTRHPSSQGATFRQLATILAIGLYTLNLGYGFDGFCTRFDHFTFMSGILRGAQHEGQPGNRFRNTCIASLPVPLPKQYVLGLDSQMRDLEQYHLPSYLRGEIKPHGGWWYYYLYGLMVKVPCGTWGLLGLIILTRALSRTPHPTVRDELILLAPAIVVLCLVSSQTGFNRHLRYIHPTLGILLVFLGQVTTAYSSQYRSLRWAARGLLLQSILSLVLVYPHQLAYFNAWAGGPRNGHAHLLGSSLDWGQDLLILRDRVTSTGEIVHETRGSYISATLFRSVIPNYRSESATGRRIVVLSPNVLQMGGYLPPQAEMLTATMWIVPVD